LSVSDDAPAEGALIVLRDVSDQAGVQRKYQEMLTEETQEKERLRGELQRKTRELMETHQTLNQAQQALMAFKKGLVG
jgi:predicted nuclease with TOPRIM domain